jgi:hypothetical protein
MEPNYEDVKISPVFKYGFLIASAVMLIPVIIILINWEEQHNPFSNLIIILSVILIFLFAYWYFSVSYTYIPGDKIIVTRPLVDETEFNMKDLIGFTYNVSTKVSSVSLNFKNGKKVNIPFIGEEVTALAQQIIKDNPDKKMR